MGGLPTTAAILTGSPQPEPGTRNVSPQSLIKLDVAHSTPPSAAYVDLNTGLRVVLVNVLSTLSIFCDIRILLPDGTIQIQREELVTTGSRSAQQFDIKMAEGFLLSVQLAGGVVFRGQVYGQISLVRGIGSAFSQTWILSHGYITTKAPVGWPNPRNDVPQARPGLISNTPVTNPGAGNDFTFTVPGANGCRSRVIGVCGLLTTSAVAGNRQTSLLFQSGGSTLYRVVVGATQAASLAIRYSWGAGGPTQTVVAANNIATGLPVEWLLEPNQTISSATAGLDAGDAWSQILVTTEDNLEM